MTENTEQTEQATETTETEETQPAPQEKSLDDLLAELDTPAQTSAPSEQVVQPAQPKPEQTDTAGQIAALQQTVQGLQNDLATRDSQADLDDLGKFLSEGTQASSTLAAAFAEETARRDPRLAQAFVNRRQNPAAWDKVKGSLKSKFQQEIGPPIDAQATESTNAMVAAVRGSETVAEQAADGPTDDQIAKMSDADYRKYEREKFPDVPPA